MRRGFTFVEMTVVIVLIAIFATLILPRAFVAQDSVKAQALLIDMRRTVDDASNRAASNGQPVVVRISTTEMTLSTTDEEGNETVFKRTPLGNGTSATVTQVNGTSVGTDDWLMKVFPDGQCSSAELEVHTRTGDLTLKRDIDGKPTWRTGTLADQPLNRWEAGTIEQRATGSG